LSLSAHIGLRDGTMGQSTPMTRFARGETLRLRPGGRGAWILEAAPVGAEEPPLRLIFSGAGAYGTATQFLRAIRTVARDPEWTVGPADGAWTRAGGIPDRPGNVALATRRNHGLPAIAARWK
jgi:hypothetical protein